MMPSSKEPARADLPNPEETLSVLRELCKIPAPSHGEQRRAAYCLDFLRRAGAEDVYLDRAQNVIYPYQCENSNAITVFAAHTDTVFPDTEEMPFREDEQRIYCPGCGDDTASVAVLLMLARYFIRHRPDVPGGILFVCNSCEEGLGNLEGTRQLFQDFSGRIRQFITFDSRMDVIADRCVGSHRYEVEVRTEGGHSFSKFGHANAICELSKIITALYRIRVPQKEGCRTTYNVGCISGGTSVNTIAQRATMLCEYRSDDRECLALMQKEFEAVFEAARSPQVQVTVRKIGERPCGQIAEERIKRLRQTVQPLIEEVLQRPVSFTASSTDCNIPLSLGIPAICIGVYEGEGAHTREEWIEKASLAQGLEIAIRAALRLTVFP